MSAKQKIKVRVISAANLIAADNGTSSDPYVVVRGIKNSVHKTRVIKKNLAPTFDQAFNVEVDRFIHFEVMDWDRFGANDPLGSVKVSMKQLRSWGFDGSVSKGEIVQTLPLTKVSRGEITIGFSATIASSLVKATHTSLRVPQISTTDLVKEEIHQLIFPLSAGIVGMSLSFFFASSSIVWLIALEILFLCICAGAIVYQGTVKREKLVHKMKKTARPKLENVNWLNDLLKAVWLSCYPEIENMVVNIVNPQLEAFKPAQANSIAITEFVLGKNSPVLDNFNVQKLANGVLRLDCHCNFESDMSILVNADVGVSTDIVISKFVARCRVRLDMNLLEPMPYIGVIRMSLLKGYQVDVDIKAKSMDMGVVGLISKWIKSMITDYVIENFFLYPYNIPIDMAYMVSGKPAAQVLANSKGLNDNEKAIDSALTDDMWKKIVAASGAKPEAFDVQPDASVRGACSENIYRVVEGNVRCRAVEAKIILCTCDVGGVFGGECLLGGAALANWPVGWVGGEKGAKVVGIKTAELKAALKSNALDESIKETLVKAICRGLADEVNGATPIATVIGGKAGGIGHPEPPPPTVAEVVTTKEKTQSVDSKPEAEYACSCKSGGRGTKGRVSLFKNHLHFKGKFFVTEVKIDLPYGAITNLTKQEKDFTFSAAGKDYAISFKDPADVTACFSTLATLQKACTSSATEVNNVSSTSGPADGLSSQDWELLQDGAKLRHYDAGQIIVEEGEPVLTLFQIAEGKVSVKKGEIKFVTLDEGSIFGEMSFIKDLPDSDLPKATASIVAEEDCSIYSIDSAHIKEAFVSKPGLAKRFYAFIGGVLWGRYESTLKKIA